MQKRKLLYIKWKDHFGRDESSWLHFDTPLDLSPLIIESVGFVLAESKEVLVLLPHLYFEDEVPVGQGELVILKNCIVERKELKL